MTQKELSNPPGKDVPWLCTFEEHTTVVIARVAFDARREACRRFHARGIVTDEQSIRVTAEPPPAAPTNGRHHVIGDGFEIVGPRHA